jgi:hypothetical protein
LAVDGKLATISTAALFSEDLCEAKRGSIFIGLNGVSSFMGRFIAWTTWNITVFYSDDPMIDAGSASISLMSAPRPNPPYTR